MLRLLDRKRLFIKSQGRTRSFFAQKRRLFRMEVDRNELVCSIARSKEQIHAVETWRDSEYKSKYEELSGLQGDLDRAIAREEQYRRQISQKLDLIAQLKASINDSIPDDNGSKMKTKTDS
jgi:hypothetical protein